MKKSGSKTKTCQIKKYFLTFDTDVTIICPEVYQRLHRGATGSPSCCFSCLLVCFLCKQGSWSKMAYCTLEVFLPLCHLCYEDFKRAFDTVIKVQGQGYGHAWYIFYCQEKKFFMFTFLIWSPSCTCFCLDDNQCYVIKSSLKEVTVLNNQYVIHGQQLMCYFLLEVYLHL